MQRRGLQRLPGVAWVQTVRNFMFWRVQPMARLMHETNLNEFR